MVVFYLFNFNWAEGSKANVKCEPCYLNTLLLYLFQELFCEVKASGWCRSTSLMLSINRLITILILKLVCDIWWKWHLA